MISPRLVERGEIAGIGADHNPAQRDCHGELRLVVAGIHSGIEGREYVNGVASQCSDQAVLCRVFVDVELHELGAQWQSRRTNTLFVGLFFDRDVSVDLLLVRVVKRQSSIDLRKG